MLKVGISGIMGSGKTTVCNIFKLLGVPVYHADREAKKFYQDEHVRAIVRNAFGNVVFDGDRVDLKNLAETVFHDKNKLSLLNSIIHPLVKNDFNEWQAGFSDKHYILYESALLFESGFYRDYDLSIVVLAPVELCLKRIRARDHVSEEHARARMSAQWAPEKKAALAEFIINNDEQQLLIPQVIDTHAKIVDSSIDF
jgi:dephospho-CoA kinase